MANTGLFDFSRAEDLRLDEIAMNSRTGYNFTPVAVNGGTLPTNFLGTNWMNGFGTPSSTVPGATSTLSAFMISTGLVVEAPSAANTSTFDTAANLVALVNARSAGAVVGDIIQFLLVNGSATNAITIAAGAGGGFDSNNSQRTLAAATSRYFFIRLTNVTPGSEAYVIYF